MSFLTSNSLQSLAISVASSFCTYFVQLTSCLSLDWMPHTCLPVHLSSYWTVERPISVVPSASVYSVSSSLVVACNQTRRADGNVTLFVSPA